MEQEYYFTGYCRTLDQSRMVEVITEGKQLLDVDCCYESCIHRPNCTIASEIETLLKKDHERG